MHRLCFIPLLLFALTICMSACPVLAWQSPEEKIIVLTNYQTIRGIVKRQPEKFAVGLPSGSLIVLPESRVLLVGQSLRGIYWELAARTRSTDSKGQIDVYKWCVRNKLFDEAANHLLMLQEMNIPAETLMQLDISLQITKKRHLESQQKIAIAHKKLPTLPQKHLPPNTRWQGDQKIEIPNLHDTAQSSSTPKRLTTIDEFGNEVAAQIDGNVQQVSWDQPISENVEPSEALITDQALRQRLRATESLSYGDLDRLTRSMPKGAVGFYRKQVEPLLHQACVGCHQSESAKGDSAFEIFQGHNGLINRRMSQKNLYQVLNLADQARPEHSQLLRYATSVHGNQSRPSFQWQDAKLNVLKQWLIMISENPFLPLEQFAPDRDQPRPPQSATPKAAVDDRSTAKRLLSNIPASQSEANDAAEAAAGQADPFDADVFNRKFGVR